MTTPTRFIPPTTPQGGSPEYDLRVISLGAGIQSTVMYYRACNGDYPTTPDLAIFADTQQERRATYAWLDELQERGGHKIPIVRVTAGDLAVDALHSMRTSPSRFLPIPAFQQQEGRRGMGRRQCTRSHKLQPIYQEIRRRLGLKPNQVGKGKFAVEVWIGISTDEAMRAKDSRYPILVNYFPLLEQTPMSRESCVRWLMETGGTVPPKSSCVFCPFKHDKDWNELKTKDPEGWGRAVRFDHAINPENHFLHESLQPLDQVQFAPRQDRPDNFQLECEGMCGV